MPRIRAASIDEHKVFTRSALIQAAKSLIAEEGTAEVPLAEVAFAAGVGRTTVYDYFSDRDDLIASIVEEELPAVLKGLLELSPAGRPSERLAELATRTVEFVATDPVLGLILHREVGRLSAPAQARIRVAHADLANMMMGIYRDGVDAAEFRAMPPDLAGRLIQDVIMSGARAVIAAPDPNQRIKDVTENVRIFLVNGLRNTNSLE